MKNPTLVKLSSEFVGTFCLVFAGTGAIVVNETTGGAVSHVGVALTFGLIVMAMIYALGASSGAHLNPAVTLALALARHAPVSSVPGYVGAQLVGACAASGLLALLFPTHESLGATLPSGAGWQSFMLEIVLTCILMLVIFSFAHAPKERAPFAGVAIGGVVALEALFAGPISGASMNPARSLAPALISGNMTSLWIYLIAPVLGAFLAIPAARLLFARGPLPNSGMPVAE